MGRIVSASFSSRKKGLMRRQFIAFALSAIGVAFSFGLIAGEGRADIKVHGGDDWVIPLDFPLPFPWNSIEGTWEVNNSKFSALFSFEVQTDCNNRQLLKVLQLDTKTKRIVARGIGYTNESQKQVMAAMSPTVGNSSYMLTVGAFNDTSKFPHKQVVALKVSSFADWDRQAFFRISKMTSSVERDTPDAQLCSY